MITKTSSYGPAVDIRQILLRICFPAGTAPKVLEPLVDQTVEAAKETALKCKISAGEPSADIHWYKDNKEIYAGKRFKVSYSGDVATLRVDDMTVADSGNYRCEAVNKLGRVETECKIVVKGESPLLFVIVSTVGSARNF